MCGRSSLLFSQTSHPSAGPKELTNPHISLFTPLIHSFNSFPADSLVSKLTRQQLAIRLQKHQAEGKVCAGYTTGGGENLIHSLSSSSLQWHFQEHDGAKSWGRSMRLCFVTAWDHWPLPQRPQPILDDLLSIIIETTVKGSCQEGSKIQSKVKHKGVRLRVCSLNQQALFIPSKSGFP